MGPFYVFLWFFILFGGEEKKIITVFVFKCQLQEHVNPARSKVEPQTGISHYRSLVSTLVSKAKIYETLNSQQCNK